MERISINLKEQLDLIKEKLTKDEKQSQERNNSIVKELRNERENIHFEVPPDFEEEEPGKMGDINFEVPRDFEDPTNPSIETRLDNLERKQDQIIKMLQQLSSRIPRVAGYLTIKEASQKYEMSDRAIHEKTHLFRRVKHRRVETRELNNEKLYKEDDLVEALLLNAAKERERLSNLQMKESDL